MLIFMMDFLIYAVVGAPIGYVLSIGICIIAMAQSPSLYLNYSSTWVVTSVGIAMIATMLGALYPLYKVAKVSVPSLERAWKPPTKPKYDTWTIPFPFIVVSEAETKAIFNYIKEFLESHKLVRSRVFQTLEVSYEEAEAPVKRRTLVSRVYLEPYEKGIKQRALLNAVWNVEAQRYFYELHLEREAGLKKDWATYVYDLVDEVRKQILLWRTLPDSEKSRYFEVQKG